MIARVLFLLASLMVTVACAGPRSGGSLDRPRPAFPAGLQEIALLVDGAPRRAALFVPEGLDPDEPAPLVLYLHGKGERGDSMEHVKHGLGKAIAAHPERFRGYVLLPQCPADRLWVAVDQPWATGLPGAEAHIDAALAWATWNLPIDRRRIVLTGLSMGGFGTLIYGARHAEQFAALAALCGGGFVEDATVLGSLPVWLIHGGADGAVKVEQSQRMDAAIRASQPSAPVRLTVYPGVGHNCWDQAYADPEVIDFLFRPGFERAR